MSHAPRVPSEAITSGTLVRGVNRSCEIYQATAVDWESGAIARVASRNETRVLILRGVSDLVSEQSDSETYGRPEVFEECARTIMRHLFGVLPLWMDVAVPSERI